MIRTLLDALGANQYQPKQICLADDRIMMTVFSAFDGLTMISYAVIGIALLIHARMVEREPAQGMRLYGYLFLLCALHRACAVATLFVGIFRLETIVDAGMVGTVAVTAVFTIKRLRESTAWTAEG